MTTPNLLSEIEYATFLNYSSRGTTRAAQLSRDVVVQGVKQDGGGVIAQLAKELTKHGDFFQEFLGSGITLIPTPRSAPLVGGALWPPNRLCEEFLSVGLGKELLPCLERIERVAKSAYAGPGQRPTAYDHYHTMEVKQAGSLMRPTQITIVDDVITKGNTLLGAASRVSDAFPDVPIRIFAMARTMNLENPDFETLVEPHTGQVKRYGVNAARE